MSGKYRPNFRSIVTLSVPTPTHLGRNLRTTGGRVPEGDVLTAEANPERAAKTERRS
jgi:hypothetical protein